MPLEEFRQSRAVAKRTAVLDAAQDLFQRNGFARTAMEEVARAAQVSTATLYRHFPSKAVLFEAVAMRSIEGLQTMSQKAQGPALARLTDMARGYAQLLSRPETRGLLRMLIGETGSGGEIAERFYGGVKSKIADSFARTVSAGIDDGVFRRHDDVNLMAGQLAGMIEHATIMRGLLLGDHAPPVRAPEEIAADAVETWMARWARDGGPRRTGATNEPNKTG